MEKDEGKKKYKQADVYISKYVICKKMFIRREKKIKNKTVAKLIFLNRTGDMSVLSV